MGFFDNVKSLFSGGQTPTLQQAAETLTKGPAPKVLVIEDEKVLADTLEQKLQYEGLSVAKAENGQVGVDTAKTFKPDVILLDLLMPVMDGKAVLKQLRAIEEFKKIPIIILTNAGTIDNMKETEFYLGATDFLIKSNVSLEQIVGKVKQHLHTN